MSEATSVSNQEPIRATMDGTSDAGVDARPSSPHAKYRIRLRLSVIFPFYNEATIASHTAAAVIAFANANPEYHFVFVDDGSTDETVKVLADSLDSAGGSSVELLSLGQNQGKGRALKAALARCLGESVCFLDGDLPYSLDHIPLLDRQLESHHVVIGSRPLAQGHGGGLSRRLYGSGFNALVRASLGLPFRDTQAGLKGLRREVAEHLFSLQKVHGFGFDAELLYLAKKFGYKVAEIPARLSPTHAYTASVRRLGIDAARTLKEVVEIRRNDRLGHYG